MNTFLCNLNIDVVDATVASTTPESMWERNHDSRAKSRFATFNDKFACKLAVAETAFGCFSCWNR